MLCIDSHLDLGLNALFYNRDLKQPVAQVRAWEDDMTGKSRGKNTVCFPELRQGDVFLLFSTILARHAGKPLSRSTAATTAVMFPSCAGLTNTLEAENR